MEDPVAPIMPGMSFNLTDEELLDFQRKSQDGNAEASHKLWLFYEFTARDHAKAADWLKRAAEQGLPAAQYGLAVYLSRRGSPGYNLQEAKLWANKAANSGEPLARRLLLEIEQLQGADNPT